MGNADSQLKDRGYNIIKDNRQNGCGTLVVKCRNVNYIVKVIKMENVPMTPEDKSKKRNHVELLTAMDHNHIVKYKDYFEDENDNMYIVMEYCNNGDLAKNIQSRKRRNIAFSEAQILRWFIQICLALKHVHDKGIVHTDLKPQRDETIKLGDFGIAKVICRKDVYATMQTGTPLYISPEVWKGEPFSNKSDVWALGCVLYELCTKNFAFPIADNILFIFDLWTEPTPPTIPGNFSPELCSLVHDLLQRNPKDRPSVDEILRKPFISKWLPQNLPEVINLQLQEPSVRISGHASMSADYAQVHERVLNEMTDLEKNIWKFIQLHDESKYAIENLIEELRTAAADLERVHFRSTVGSLTGGVVGAAGGITSVVGLILAPFTLGASLIVTGVGVGVAVAGGVGSAASNITNSVNQSAQRKNVERIISEYREKMEPILMTLENISDHIEKLKNYRELLRNKEILLNAGSRFARGLGGIAELTRLIQVTSIGRTAAQAARAVRVAEAFTGVLAGVFLLLDVIFIYKDSKEIHNLRNANTDIPGEDNKGSAAIKVKAEILKIADTFENIANDVSDKRERIENSLSECPSNSENSLSECPCISEDSTFLFLGKILSIVVSVYLFFYIFMKGGMVAQ